MLPVARNGKGMEGLRCRLIFFNQDISSLHLDNTRWLSNPEPNTWSGIVIEDGNVTKIILSGNNLSGVLPDVFAALPKLKVLYLNGNDLKGEIPVYV